MAKLFKFCKRVFDLAPLMVRCSTVVFTPGRSGLREVAIEGGWTDFFLFGLPLTNGIKIEATGLPYS